MRKETEGYSGPGWARPLGIGTSLLLFALLGVLSRQDIPRAEAGPLLPWLDPRSNVEQGEVTLPDGKETQVRYKKVFQSPPHLVVVEFRGASFLEKPYAKSDFQIMKEDAKYFKIRNNHPEMGRGSWATIKWRAEGVLASDQSARTGAGLGPLGQNGKTTKEDIVAWVKKEGGTTLVDGHLPGYPIVSIDLPHTAVTDADLELFRDLTYLHTLNLFGTRITDAGLGHLTRLTGLQKLYLNETAVTDAGLPQLQGLTGLQALGLNNTQVTDAGLIYLRSLTNLRELALSGPKITDRGLRELKGLRNLKHLYLNHTSVTPAGLEELRKALPGIKAL